MIMIKLGREKYLVPGTALIWGPLVLGRSRPLKNRRWSGLWPQNTRKEEKARPAPLDSSQGFTTFIGFIGSACKTGFQSVTGLM